jgi:predicted RND superfamily exporter protein
MLLESLLAFILRRPAISLTGTIALTVVLGLGLLRLELRTDGAAIYPEENPIVLQTEADRDAFYDPEQVIILLSSHPSGPPMDCPGGFRFIKNIHRSLSEIPGLDGDGIHSLASLLDVRSNLETMIITTYLDSIPDDRESFQALLGRLREAPFVDGLYLSADGRLASIYVPLAEGADRKRVLTTLDDWLQTHDDVLYDIRITGPLIAEATLGDLVLKDLSILIPVMVAVVALMLLATLRTFGGLLIPLAEAVLVLIWTLGLMGWVGAPVTLVTTILPVILMTMAITDEIHLLQAVQAYMKGTRGNLSANIPARDRLEKATMSALLDVGRPIIATSLTTSIGFLSFLAASMMPMRHFGLFTAFGIMSAMVLSFTFIPCLIIKLPPGWFHPPVRHKQKLASPKLIWMERFAAQRTSMAFRVGLIIILAGLPGLLWLDVQDSWVDNFDRQSTLVSADKDFNRSFWGSYRFDVVFEGDQGLFYQREGASLTDQFRSSVSEASFVGGMASYHDILREVAKGMGMSDRLTDLSDNEIQDLATIAEMSGDPKQMMQLIDDEGATLRARIFVNSPNYQRSEQLADHVNLIRQSIEENYQVTSHISGDIPVAMEVVSSVVINQMRSISWTLLGIAILLLLTFPRRLAALIAMVPVTTTAILVLAVMGYAGMPLGIATSMFASLTIGVGIDFALHFMHNYKRERKGGLDHQPALNLTLENAGQAIRWNALVLILGFAALTFSGLKPDRDLGILLALAIGTCYIMTLLLLPRLLKGLTLAIALLVFAIPASASAQTGEPQPSEDPAARALMRQLETDFRKVRRVVKVEFSTIYARVKNKPFKRTMWGVLDGDTMMTRMMWVVTDPPRMSGTTLMFADKADTAETDSTWLNMSSSEYVRLLSIRSARAMVPGTALTYEDSRGFVPVDKYRFKFAANSNVSPDSLVIITAEPITEKIRVGVGVDAMILRIDMKDRILKEIDYLKGEGELFKTYRLEKTVKIGDVWFPARMSVRNYLHRNISTAEYTYWSLPDDPPDAFYNPDLEGGRFLDRLKGLLKQEGIEFQPAGFESGKSDR